MRFNFSVVIFSLSLFAFCPGFAQDSIPTKKKISPFVYNEIESEITYDIGINTGFANGKASISARAQMDVYHILVGYGIDLMQVDDAFFVQSLHGGYRYRNQNIMIALMSGYSWERYHEGFFEAVPVELQFHYIISNKFGVGITGRNMFCPETDITSILFGIKFGNLRSIY